MLLTTGVHKPGLTLTRKGSTISLETPNLKTLDGGWPPTCSRPAVPRLSADLVCRCAVLRLGPGGAWAQGCKFSRFRPILKGSVCFGPRLRQAA